MSISAKQVKELRDKTGAGMMECKKALLETDGNLDEAVKILRERGLAAASKKAGRATQEGVVGHYIHAGEKIGVIAEVNCETDFVARTDDFQQLVRDVAMQVAAANPVWVAVEEVDEAVLEAEKEIYRNQAIAEGKPDEIADKIVEGRLKKYYSEVCLYEQPFIKDGDVTVGELVKAMIAKLGENISVRRFARFEVGEETQ